MGNNSFERTIHIRFTHCDPSRTVFFPNYFALFNDLIETWFDEVLRIPYADLLGPRGIGLPTAHLECDFKAVCRMGEAVPFALAVQRIGSKSLTLALRAGRAEQPRLTARQVLVFTHLDTHQSMSIPPDVRAALERFANPQT